MSSKTYLNAEHTISKYFDDDLMCDVVEKEYTIYNRDVFECLKENHWPGIPKIFDIKEYEDKLVVKEEWIDGTDLHTYVEENGPMKESQVLDILIQLCNTLEPLHKNKIIHRDIKPSNVLLCGKKVVLIDFNAGKTIDILEKRDTVLLGTAGFAAPEQYGFGASSIETDIYGLGALAKYIFTEDNDFSFTAGKLVEIIQKCIQLKPSDRYRTVKDLRNDLNELIIPETDNTTQEDETQSLEKIYRHYLPVGYRSGKISHYILATCYYLFIFLVIISITVKESDGRITDGQMKFICAAMFIFPVLFHFNYLDIQKRLHIKRNDNSIIYWSKILIYDAILIYATVFVLTMIFWFI